MAKIETANKMYEDEGDNQVGELQFIKNYRDDKQLRESFLELANQTFGINFKSWFEHGYWGEKYIPFSYVKNNKIVSNVSVNVLDLMIDGKQHRAIQIGTVMTHPDYRHQGLSKRLMNRVLEEYDNKYDIMYLFANESVLDFYPKFGFTRTDQHQYYTSFSPNGSAATKLQKLTIDKKEDLHFIESFANERIPVSSRFATKNAQELLLYHCLNTFRDSLYYHPTEDAMVLLHKESSHIELFDLVSKNKVNLQHILADLSDGLDHCTVAFHYTPDDEGIEFECKPFKDRGALFVKTNGNLSLPTYVKFPVTSEA